MAKTSRGVGGRRVMGTDAGGGVDACLGRETSGTAPSEAAFSLAELSKTRDLILLPRKDFLHERLQEAHAR